MRASVSESIEDEHMKSMEEDTTRNSIEKVLEEMKLYNRGRRRCGGEMRER